VFKIGREGCSKLEERGVQNWKRGVFKIGREVIALFPKIGRTTKYKYIVKNKIRFAHFIFHSINKKEKNISLRSIFFSF